MTNRRTGWQYHLIICRNIDTGYYKNIYVEESAVPIVNVLLVLQ